MSLSDAQTVALFQILDVPLSTSRNTVDNTGMLVSSQDLSSPSQTAAKTAIDTAVLALTADRETTLKVDLNRWLEMGSSSGKIVGGGIGGLSGFQYDYDEERRNIRSRVLIMLPYYKHHEALERQNGDNGFSIRVIR